MSTSYIARLLSLEDLRPSSPRLSFRGFLTQARPLPLSSLAPSSPLLSLLQSLAEKQAVEVVRGCLDVFVQRLSVTQDLSQKHLLQLWYEALTLITNAAAAATGEAGTVTSSSI
jgi:hypothetical protein